MEQIHEQLVISSEVRAMKRVILPLISLLVVLSACTTPDNTVDKNTASAQYNSDEITPFSYSCASSVYVVGDPGVICEGFNNTMRSPILSKDDAIDLAKNEVSAYFDYDTVAVYYDNVCEIWMVLFYTEHTIGGGQSVYLNADGMTVLIVFGE